ncbi:MAG TPA: Hsp33 family molecular chaperone HslO [Dokdonella sp.]|uniref:Hsp33 family molecular chaperone HslO n=1 Tax=Dokdonella sp. TaxID=2291710 RepID=UPI002D80248B|nr:Hsp33 family molecular chaperone HslO [Dokdonella sp.]HET9031543.1 Hsp33 family molecular chaperone HslO [Dokdonella sp.]
MKASSDMLHTFQLAQGGVRGSLVRLEASWEAILAHADYAAGIKAMLGESLVASALFASALKFEGRLSIQLRNAGALNLLFAECTHDGGLRGIARSDGETSDCAVNLSADDARLAITIENQQTDSRYQGLVAVASENLATAFEGYFERSEQLPTRLMLVQREGRCAGIMLQKIADVGGSEQVADDDAWGRVGHLLATLSEAELLDLPVETLLFRLFHEEGVILQPGRALRFECSCSPERVLGMLRSLGREEAMGALGEENQLEITCEFCNRRYRFDSVDITGLFADLPQAPGSPRSQ